ncbi:MAG: DUF2191 domain-containing protein [Dehalococcoidia bacterium]|nr:DUF2191 domain-containing protein [Dehalococcoidia bacterium]
MKTTIELPDDLFREAKATAARRGTALKQFVREALAEKLAREGVIDDVYRPRDWPVPPIRLDPEEAALIDRAIEEAFEQIEPEDLA